MLCDGRRTAGWCRLLDEEGPLAPCGAFFSSRSKAQDCLPGCAHSRFEWPGW